MVERQSVSVLKMVIIVDTNIVFSALLNVESTIAKIMLSSNFNVQFVSADFLKNEIDLHWEKLQSLSKIDANKLSISREKIYSKIEFFSADFISNDCFLEAKKLTQHVDFDDVLFVALTISLNGYLWTGNKKLYYGIKNNGFDKVILTQELLKNILPFFPNNI